MSDRVGSPRILDNYEALRYGATSIVTLLRNAIKKFPVWQLVSPIAARPGWLPD